MKNILFSAIFKNTTWQLLGKAATATTTFIITIILGKFLGEAQYGDFAKAFALVETLYVFVDFGLNAIFVKTAVDEKKESSLLSQLAFIRLLISITVIGLIGLTAFFLPYSPITGFGFSQRVKLGIILASVTTLTYAATLTAQAGFQLKLRFNKQLAAQIIGSLTKLVFILIVILISPTFLNIILAVVAGEIVLSSTSLYLAFSNFGKIESVFDLKKTRKFFAKTAPIGLSLIFNLFYFRGDMLILSSFKSSAEVGNYSLAYKFFEVSLVVPIFFVNSVYPAMLRSLKTNIKIFTEQIISYSRLLLAVSVFAGIVLFFTGSLIIKLIFKQNFESAILLLQILSLGLPFFYLSAIYMWGIITLGAQKVLLPVYAAGAFLNLAFNFLLIPTFGAIAAALITIISEGLILLVLYFVYRYFLKQAINHAT